MTREWKAAVKRGSTDELQHLLQNGADIDARDEHGQTGLMLAAAEGDGALVDWLIERGAALNHTAKHGLSALMLALVRGRVDVVRRLAESGADLSLRGTGAPGFAGKTALELATDRDDPEMVAILRSAAIRSSKNPHFQPAANWKAARAMLTFRPRQPGHTAGFRLQSIQIYIRDYKLRELAVGDRTLEAYYGGFVLSQARKGAAEARRLALDVSYGRESHDVTIAGCPGRAYEHGPEPEPDDIDGRSPSVVVWEDGEMLYFISSEQMSAGELMKIAVSLYS
jgi:hypothetical protein